MRLSFLCLIAVSTAASTRRPHILMVVADDLGWNDVSFHGSTQIPTPTLDELANDGVQLNNYYVQPVCSPTRSCLLTGRHVIHSGIYDPDCGQGTTYAVPLNFTMLPRHLKAFNYESHAVGKWHLVRDICRSCLVPHCCMRSPTNFVRPPSLLSTGYVFANSVANRQRV